MSKHTISFSDKKVVYHLKYKNVKNINISVKPDQEVYVSAPNNADFVRIEEYVKEKALWIIKQQKQFKATAKIDDIEKDYVDGESFKFLGVQYRLKVLENNDNEFVKVGHKHIYIYTKKKNGKTRNKRLLNEWFRNQAHVQFQKAIDNTYQLAENMFEEKPNLEVKKMTKRWGSCLRKKNTVLMNLELIKAPLHCIEYVALHEMIHFKHKNHNKVFYDKLTVLMPDWKQRKEILDEEIVLFV